MQDVAVRIMQDAHAKDLPLPKYMSDSAAGMDIVAAVTEDIILKPGDIKLIPTGLRIALPEGYEAQIRPRSGLALKHGITLLNTPGTIDADYRGEIGIIVINAGHEDFAVSRGLRIAQMVINRYERANLIEVQSLDETARGEGGFGHTGC